MATGPVTITTCSVRVYFATGIDRHNGYLPVGGYLPDFAGVSKDYADVARVRFSPSAFGVNVDEINLAVGYGDIFGADYCVVTYNDGTPPVFCFIDDMEYVSENTTRLHIAIDYVATLMANLVATGNPINAHIARATRNDDNWAINAVQTQNEPLSVPMVTKEVTIKQFDDILDPMGADSNMRWVVYACSNKNGDIGPDQYKVQYMNGVPILGHVEVFSDVNGVLDWVRSFLSQKGYMASSYGPSTPNIVKIMLLPSELCQVTDGWQEPWSREHIGVQLAFPEIDFQKVLGPQFCPLRFFWQNSLQSLAIDLTEAVAVADKLIVFDFSLRSCGGINPQLKLYLNLGEGQSQKDWGMSVASLTFPELNVFTYQKDTWTSAGIMEAMYGQIKNHAESFHEYLGDKQKKMARAGRNMKGQFIKKSAAQAARKAAAVEAVYEMAGAVVESGENVALYATSLADSATKTLIHGDPSPDFSLANGLYGIRLGLALPNKEGMDILNSFFSAFGYAINRYMSLKPTDLVFRCGASYLKTKSELMGQYPFPRDWTDAFSSALNDGYTWWEEKIGALKVPEFKGWSF